jgi:zeaxanthin glucosyltransferase
MKTVIFLIFPIPSHFLSTFPLAKELNKKGYRITYASTMAYKDIIEEEGFEFINFRYAEEYRISSLKAFVGVLLQSMFSSNFIRLRYREFYALEILGIENLYNVVRPELIFIDEHLSAYYLGFFNYKTRVIFLNTKLSTRKKNGIPPLDSSYIPSNSIFSNLVCEFKWWKHLLNRKYLNLLTKLAFLGYDDVFFYKRVCKKRFKQDWKRLITERASFYYVIEDKPTLILAPQSIEYSLNKPLEMEYYLNLPITRDETKYFTNDYLELRNNFKDMLIGKRKLIYCGFGMINSIDYEKVLLLLNKIIRSVRTQKDWIVVISTSGVSYPVEPISDNTYVFKYIPQLDILKYCNLMITHGGLTSIKECLQYKVPMLVYPINTNGDTNGNAARVFKNGFGLRGSITRDTPEMISKKVSQLLLNPLPKLAISDEANHVLENLLLTVRT